MLKCSHKYDLVRKKRECETFDVRPRLHSHNFCYIMIVLVKIKIKTRGIFCLLPSSLMKRETKVAGCNHSYCAV